MGVISAAQTGCIVSAESAVRPVLCFPSGPHIHVVSLWRAILLMASDSALAEAGSLPILQEEFYVVLPQELCANCICRGIRLPRLPVETRVNTHSNNASAEFGFRCVL